MVMKELTSDWLKQLPVKVKDIKPVSGGDINDSYSITTDNNPSKHYFMKVQPNQGAEFFNHEVNGLQLLSQAANVPKVIDHGTINKDGYLILNWIDQGSGSQYELGKMVARLHKVHNKKFGLDHDDVGKIPLSNKWNDNWATFFINQRLEPLKKRAETMNLWQNEWNQPYENLKQNIKDYYKTHHPQPSLLHGDLWSGNFLFDKKGEPMLIDPNVFYGDREFDIGITTVFGGFNQDFYRGYNEVYPLAPGVEKRILWYQFYYILLHLNLFGSVYSYKLNSILNNFQ